jgi:hypothetical protein
VTVKLTVRAKNLLKIIKLSEFVHRDTHFSANLWTVVSQTTNDTDNIIPRSHTIPTLQMYNSSGNRKKSVPSCDMISQSGAGK